MTPGDLPQPAPQLVFLPSPGTAGKALGRPVLTDDPTGTAFGDPEAIDEHDHRPPLALRGQTFPSASSLSIDLSRSTSASSFLQPGVLGLQPAQPLRLIGLHPAVLRPPAIRGDLGDLEVPHHLGDVLPLVEQSLAPTELADNLLGRMPVSLHRGLSSCPACWADGLPQQVDHSPEPRSSPPLAASRSKRRASRPLVRSVTTPQRTRRERKSATRAAISPGSNAGGCSHGLPRAHRRTGASRGWVLPSPDDCRNRARG